MKTDSKHWDLKLGVCTKHMLPSVPCPSCLAGDGDPDLEFIMEEIDWLVCDFDGVKPHQLVPKNIKNPNIR